MRYKPHRSDQQKVKRPHVLHFHLRDRDIVSAFVGTFLLALSSAPLGNASPHTQHKNYLGRIRLSEEGFLSETIFLQVLVLLLVRDQKSIPKLFGVYTIIFVYLFY